MVHKNNRREYFENPTDWLTSCLLGFFVVVVFLFVFVFSHTLKFGVLDCKESVRLAIRTKCITTHVSDFEVKITGWGCTGGGGVWLALVNGQTVQGGRQQNETCGEEAVGAGTGELICF